MIGIIFELAKYYIEFLCKKLKGLPLIVLMLAYIYPLISNAQQNSQLNIFGDMHKIHNETKITFPDELLGTYYYKSPGECWDFQAGFESRLQIDKRQIQFGVISHCKISDISRKKIGFRVKVFCYHEEGTSNSAVLEITKISQGVAIGRDVYKNCSMKKSN